MPSQPPRPTGVGRVGLELSRRLLERGQGRWRFDFRGQYSREQLGVQGVRGFGEVITIPAVSGHLAETLKSSVLGLIQPNAYDVVLNVDPLGMAAGGRRRLTILNDLYFKAAPELYTVKGRWRSDILYGLTLRASHLVACISHTTERDALRFYPSLKGRTCTIPLGSTLEDTGAPLPSAIRSLSTSGRRYVLAVANASVNKNFGVLADAFVGIARDRADLHLVHVGADPENVFGNRLAAEGLGDRFTRLTGIDDAALAACYREALCLCVPSLYEGFCLPIVEAQRNGCCVVFSERSASGEIGGDGGIPFDPQNAAALATALASVADNAQLRGRLRQAGFRNAEQYTWDRTARLYEEEIARLIVS